MAPKVKPSKARSYQKVDSRKNKRRAALLTEDIVRARLRNRRREGKSNGRVTSAAITSSVPPENSDPAASSVSVSTLCVSSSATPPSGRAESVAVPSVSGVRIKSIIIVKPPRAQEKSVSRSSERQAQAFVALTSMPPRVSALRLALARLDPGMSEPAKPMSLEEAPEEEHYVSELAVAYTPTPRTVLAVRDWEIAARQRALLRPPNEMEDIFATCQPISDAAYKAWRADPFPSTPATVGCCPDVTIFIRFTEVNLYFVCFIAVTLNLTPTYCVGYVCPLWL
ncbi:unnamed protein product [Trichogramma brassicae]|uniref:Uncharacterized protein n=1 Tax=Trichogramma brassicae TaxID=86971 RepID=A0A6H5IT74_9HYME|nr:unnamed protein product [Trichogramma brassicae]